MAMTKQSPVTLALLMKVGGSCLTPLDAAAEYWRSRADQLLPMYLLAMAPHAIFAGLLIAAITGERRSLAGQYCLYLAAATLWRWVWISRLQWQVQQDLRAQPLPGFWSRLPQIFLLRLYSSVGVNWGILLAGVPAFYGFFLGSFAAPLLLESDDPTTRRVRQALSWIHHSGKRLFRIMVVMTVVTLLLLVALFASQYILSRTLLPSLLGMDTADLDLTLNGWAWRLSLCYFVFLIVDAFWSVAAVLVYYDSQSRRTGTDLQARLTALTEGDV
jgi:hypothetical protein